MASIIKASLNLDAIPKEERDAKSPRTYLGNVKVVWSNGNNVNPAPRDGEQAPAQTAPQVDDLPF